MKAFRIAALGGSLGLLSACGSMSLPQPGRCQELNSGELARVGGALSLGSYHSITNDDSCLRRDSAVQIYRAASQAGQVVTMGAALRRIRQDDPAFGEALDSEADAAVARQGQQPENAPAQNYRIVAVPGRRDQVRLQPVTPAP